MNLDLIISEVLLEQAQKICNRVRSEWESSMRPGISGNKEISVGNLMVIKGAVIVEIISTGMAAWIMEMGKGSLMEKSVADNPYLQDYLSSDEVNPWRFHSSRMPIMGRSEGEYKDLDGGTHSSSGRMQGLDLERDGEPEYQPVLPMHIIRTEVKQSLPIIAAELSSALSKAIADDISYMLTAKIYM